MIIGRKRAEKDGNGEGKERRMGKESRGGRAGKGRGERRAEEEGREGKRGTIFCTLVFGILPVTLSAHCDS